MALSKTPQPPAQPRLHYSLTFPLQQHESIYVERRTAVWTARDLRLFVVAICFAPAKVATFTSPNAYHTILHSAWAIVMLIVCPLTFLLMILRGSNVYFSKRVHLMSAHRMMVMITGAFLIHDYPELWGHKYLLVRMITRSPICGLFFSTLHRMPFRQHAWVHLCSTMFSSVWLLSLCAASNANSQVEQQVNLIGWFTEGAIIRSAVFGLAVNRYPLQPGQYSCLLVGLFYHIWLGFFLPTFGVYVVELLSRLKFLRDWGGHGADEDLKVLKVGRLLLAGVVLLVGTQVLWFFLKSVLTSKVLSMMMSRAAPWRSYPRNQVNEQFNDLCEFA